MRRLILASAPAVLFTMFFLLQTSWAVTVNLTDAKEVPMRSGPSTRNKVTAMIPPGSAVEVVKKEEWTRVRFTTPEGVVKDGWVDSSYLQAALTRGLEKENAGLKDQLSGFDKERSDFTRREKELTDKLTKLQADYETLKSGSTDYIKVRDEYEATKAALATAQETIQSQDQENENLKLSQSIRWFGAGALVIFLGWIIGWFSGRQRKRSRSSYYL